MPVGEPYHPKSQSTEWNTPPELFDALDAEFGPFTFDPACSGSEHTAKVIAKRGGTLCLPPGSKRPNVLNLTKATTLFDGLAQHWSGRVFLNCPYGRGSTDKWVAHAVDEVESGNVDLVCALLKATPDVRWWQKHVLREVSWHARQGDDPYADTIQHPLVCLVRFLTRLKFSGHEDSAPFPSAIVIWSKI